MNENRNTSSDLAGTAAVPLAAPASQASKAHATAPVPVPPQAQAPSAPPEPALARVVVVGLASCFGCQLQITNIESHLIEVLGQFDLRYWQLTSDGHMPEDFDVAVIEGAVTTEESLAAVLRLRERAKAVITVGACANTAGIPGLASTRFDERLGEVYQHLPQACGTPIAPRSVPSVITVDYAVPCCPIDPFEFLEALGRALYGSNRTLGTRTMCGDCKRNESACFYNQGSLCLGLVTRAGCNARCVNLGRPCNGCRGVSPHANLESAREAVARYGLSVKDFDLRLELFNQTNPVLSGRE
ncbi:MAG: NADH:ubiquinone oxidoreductase [Coriobacteriaceae bacterium]|jgi:coenzyme F420-reducing hydrogenase gamma subunit|nr:NADH:ubiquinone oxidoreductase [Coriobacteriaceae bacterium]